jgi:CubicO group peptidase (beta-lactamase class C family)
MAVVRIEGTSAPGFERVRDAFAGNFADHDELGASVAISVGGRLVVDLWGGWADEARTRPWQADTLVNVFSVGKGIVAVCMLMLVDRGLVDLDAPVARYWPEFAAGGKEGVTVRCLLSHQAGLPAVREKLPPRAMYDWELMARALAAQVPWWTPGTKHGYHVNTFGFLAGEILRRTTGKSVGAFLREELTGPLAADFHIGVPAALDARVADFVWLPELADIPTVQWTMLTDSMLMSLHTYFNPPGASGHGTVNTTAWRRAEYPSTNGHASARGVARLYEVVASRGTIGGKGYVSRVMLEEAAREQSSGLDVVLGRPSRFGLGFQLPALDKPIGPNPGVVMHFGAGGALGFADPVAEVAFGYAMNRMGPRFASPTNRALIDALYSCL